MTGLKSKLVWFRGKILEVAYTDEQAAGALPNGSRIVKQKSGPGDTHGDGAVGTVVGSIGLDEVLGVGERVPGYPDVRFTYFVEWDDMPDIPNGVVEGRIRLLP